MSDDKEPPKNPFEDLQKQVQDLLKNGNFQFITPSGFNAKRDESDTPDNERGDSSTDGDGDDEPVSVREFDRKPREVKDFLDRYVIKQPEAKKVLSVAICDHYNHVRRCLDNPERAGREYTKQNVILLGPTGVGKTYLMKNIARLIGVPFIKADATKFSETGYVGHDVDDIVRDLVKAADGDVERASYGIIYIDEVDKIASQMSSGAKDVSGRGVQTNLLKLMEDTEVKLTGQNDMMGQMQAMMDFQKGRKRASTISTRHMLFIVSGAFMGMIDSIKKRMENKTIGFASATADFDDESDYLKFAETRDFIDFGFEPEFIGRLPVRVACENLNADDLEEILTAAENNILRQYREDFKGYGIELVVEPDAIRRIAERAESERTGARGLMTVLERMLREFKFHLPSTAVKKFVLTTEVIDDPQAALDKLLQSGESEQKRLMKQDMFDYAERFEEEHGLMLAFSDSAIDALIAESLKSGKTVRALCEQKFKDYQYGLKLISKNTGQEKFAIDKEAILDPDSELNTKVLESYNRVPDSD